MVHDTSPAQQPPSCSRRERQLPAYAYMQDNHDAQGLEYGNADSRVSVPMIVVFLVRGQPKRAAEWGAASDLWVAIHDR